MIEKDLAYRGIGEQIFIVGDRNTGLPDLTPPGMNVSNRLVKHLRIAGSGLYKYHRSEAKLYGLDESVLPGDQEYFTVYRPSEVLTQNANMFARIPIITGHHVLVDDSNAKRLMVGLVGDEVRAEVDPKDGETYLVTTGTIVAGDGLDAYERWGQLSVGYIPKCIWESGTYKGKHYDARLTGFDDVNHLLICEKARGGPQCMVMDSITDTPLECLIKKFEEGNMNIFKKIFGNSAPIAGDERIPLLLKSIAVGADPATQVAEIKKILPSQKIAGDALTTLTEYLDELAISKDEQLEVKSKACDVVCQYYNKVTAGDEDKKEEKEKKGGESDPAGDEKDEDKKEDKKEEKKDSAGDAVFTIKSLDELKGLITEVVKSVLPPVAGDEAKKDTIPPVDPNVIGQLNTLIAGDANNNQITSDAYMKNVFGKEVRNGSIF